jgi:hypothetical protein
MRDDLLALTPDELRAWLRHQREALCPTAVQRYWKWT